ncbi:MAG: hypothetical protein GY772_19785, partial [bacterium]|nr:hypothetical protein [bacterium]
TIARVFDFFHRDCNDTAMARAKSGLTPVYLASIAILNVGYGPYETCAWFQLMLAQAADLARNLSPNDPLLLRLWKRILRDKELHLETKEELVGEAARERFVKELAVDPSVDLKSIKCKPSVWYSFNTAFHAWDAKLHTRGLVLGALCLQKGWLLAAEDLFCPEKTRKFGVQPG